MPLSAATISRLLAASAMVLAVAVALGQGPGPAWLAAPLPGRAAMHEGAAVVLLLAGWAVLRPGKGQWQLRSGAILAVALAIAAMALLDPGLFHTAPGGAVFGRSEAAMGAGLALAAGALWQGRAEAAQGLAVLALFPVAVTATGLAHGLDGFAGEMPPAAMLGGGLLGLAVMLRTRHVGLVAVLLARGPGAAAMRRPMLLVGAVGVAIGGLARWLSDDPGLDRWLALTTVLACYGAVALLLQVQGRLDRLDRLDPNAATRGRETGEMAQRDPLTGLQDRRAFDAAIAALGAAPAGACVLMLDIDRFKAINDRFGHAAGDAALVRFGAILRAGLPRGAVPARLGGGAFAALLPATALGEARVLAEALRAGLAAAPVPLGPGREADLRVSIGCAECRAGEAMWQCLDRADAALHAAKAAGRNRVSAAGPMPGAAAARPSPG